MPHRELIVGGPSYFSMGDEHAFFHWLQSIPCVESVIGRSTDLCIRLRRPPSRADLRELIAVLYRYQMDMKPLAALRTARNSSWFAENPEVYWHAPIFGSVRPSAESRRHRKIHCESKEPGQTSRLGTWQPTTGSNHEDGSGLDSTFSPHRFPNFFRGRCIHRGDAETDDHVGPNRERIGGENPGGDDRDVGVGIVAR
jgi:hypothetical protein